MTFGIGSFGLRRAAQVLLLALPVLAFGGSAAADSFSFTYGSGLHNKRHFHHRPLRHHHRPAFGRHHYHRYYHRPAVVVRRTVVVDQPVVVAPYAPVCSQGLWRQLDGSVVEGVACKQANGVWQLQ